MINNSMPPRHATQVRSAFTIIELLVALVIVSVLTIIALPSLKEAFRQDALARSASVVQSAFLNARAQAMRSGRPFGVVIQRLRNDVGGGAVSNLNLLTANYSTRLYFVQSPMEYQGDIPNASVIPIYDQDFSVFYFFVPQASSGLLSASTDAASPARNLLGPFCVQA